MNLAQIIANLTGRSTARERDKLGQPERLCHDISLSTYVQGHHNSSKIDEVLAVISSCFGLVMSHPYDLGSDRFRIEAGQQVRQSIHRKPNFSSHSLVRLPGRYVLPYLPLSLWLHTKRNIDDSRAGRRTTDISCHALIPAPSDV